MHDTVRVVAHDDTIVTLLSHTGSHQGAQIQEKAYVAHLIVVNELNKHVRAST